MRFEEVGRVSKMGFGEGLYAEVLVREHHLIHGRDDGYDMNIVTSVWIP
jgi:hypothetical protein